MATSVKQEETDTATTLIHHHDTITAPQDSDDATANGNGTEMMDTSDTDGTDGTDDKSQRENSTDLDSSSATINSQAEPKEERAVSAEDAAKYDQARGVMREELANGTLGLSPRRKRKTAEELKNLSTRNYLDETVVPTLLNGMSELARTRPEKPLEWLAKFLERAQEREDRADGGGVSFSASEEQQSTKRANMASSITLEASVTGTSAGGDTAKGEASA